MLPVVVRPMCNISIRQKAAQTTDKYRVCTAVYTKTRNAWQSLECSPLGVIVSPLNEYL